MTEIYAIAFLLTRGEPNKVINKVDCLVIHNAESEEEALGEACNQIAKEENGWAIFSWSLITVDLKLTNNEAPRERKEK